MHSNGRTVLSHQSVVLERFSSFFLMLCTLTTRLVRVLFMYSKCPLKDAEFVMIEEFPLKDEENVSDERTLFLNNVVVNMRTKDIFFEHKGFRYVFEDGRFVCHDFGVSGMSFSEIHNKAKREEEREDRRRKFGPNILKVPVPTWLELLVDEVFSPFYMFQVFSCVIWILQRYYIYSACIFILASGAVTFRFVAVVVSSSFLLIF